ncbi:MAG: hypothetical protein IKL62_03155 [Clostridia bacterium]|nr:hypothetical protein [Clostridia bacterium]
MADNKTPFFSFGEPPKAPDFVKIRESSTPPQPKPPPPKPPPEPPKPPARRVPQLLKMLNLRGIEFDADRKIIIAVMLLLLGETDDELLLLALIYIML